MSKELLFYFFNENWIIIAGFFMAMVMTINTFSAAKYTSLSPEMAIKAINNGVQIFDVREAEEYRKGHIKGASNMPLSDLKNLLTKWQNKNTTTHPDILFYCASGHTSINALKQTKKMGYKGNLINLQGGINAWKQANYPTSKEKK